MFKKTVTVLSFFLALSVSLLGSANTAAADNVGNAGVLALVEIVDDDSDDSVSYRGRVVLDEGASIQQEYYWGGVLCSNRDLDVSDEALLASVLANKKLRLVPAWKGGMAGKRCLVAFTLTDKKNAALLP